MTALAAGVALNAGTLAFGQSLTKPDPKQDFQVPFQAQQSPIFFFKRETFQPYVGGTFTIRAGAHSVEATLKEVRDCTPNPNSKVTTATPRKSDCFALVFESTGSLTDLTSIYTVDHAALGTFDLFMTRRSPADGTYIYEAVINHAL